jgi:hypothetical protein
MAAIISATVSACGSAAMTTRRSVPGAASTASMAADRFSRASSERRALRLASCRWKGRSREPHQLCHVAFDTRPIHQHSTQ